MSDFVSNCQSLISDKVTERRNAAKNLRDFFQAEYICKQLDGHITWDGLFASVKEFVIKETEYIIKIERGKRMVTGSTLVARNQLKHDVAETMRTFVGAFSSHGNGSIKIKEIIRHILQIINHPRLSLLLIKDYSSLLHHDILTRNHYIVDIPSSQWKELVDTYCRLFLDPPVSFDQSISARIIHCLITQSSHQYDIIDDLFKFFNQALESFNLENNNIVLEPLLAALNKYCSVVAPNARSRLCNFGEHFILPLLQVWRRTSLTVKNQIIEFLWTQVRVHHPLGSCCESQGSWAANDGRWNDCVDKIFELVVSELEGTSKQLKLTSGGEGVICPLFIDLSVDVMYQVFHVKQRCDFQEPQSKKRKMNTEWSVLTEHLSSGSKPALLTWLQVASHMFTKWPNKLPSTELLLILLELQKLLQEKSRVECTYWLYICLRTLACQSQSHVINELKDVWKKIWATTLRNVQSKICEDEGLTLLTAIVQHLLIEIDNEPWKLIPSNQPTRSFVTFIATLMLHHTLPESLLPTLTLTSADDNHIKSQYPLRTTLLHFLIPLNGGMDHDHLITLDNRPSVTLTAHVLVALVQQSCSLSCDSDKINEWITSEYQTQLQNAHKHWFNIETIYLHSSLHLNPLSADEDRTPKTNEKHDVLLGPLCHYLCTLLHERTQYLLQVTFMVRAGVLFEIMEAQIYHYAVTLHVVNLLYQCGIEFKEICSLPAVNTLPLLLQKVCSGLQSHIGNESSVNMHYKVTKNVIEILSSVLQLSVLQSEDDMMKKLFSTCFHEQLLTIICDIARGKYDKISHTDSVASTGFDESDMMYSSPSKDNHSPTSTSSSTISSCLSHTPLDVFDSAVLSERSSTQLAACCFLVLWFLTDMDKIICVKSVNSWSTLEEILGDEDYDLSAPKKLQLVFSVSSKLINLSLLCNKRLGNNVLIGILSVLRRVLSRNKKNQVVYKHSLSLLCEITPHLVDAEKEGSDGVESISLYITVLSGFCNLINESLLTAAVRCVLADVLLQAYHVSCDLSHDIVLRRNKTEDGVSIEQMLISMLNDSHHSVRIKMAKIISSLFKRGGQMLPYQQQENLFEKIKIELDHTNMVQSDLDVLSAEDESVNRIASMLCTLQCIGCMSTSCERHVISMMINAVGHGYVDAGLVTKVIDNISNYLGYSDTSLLLKSILSYLISQWLNEGTIDNFPYIVFKINSKQEFFRKYSHIFIPHLLWSFDRAPLDVISEICDQPLSELLSSCVPVCMLFIVTTYAEEERENDERRMLASSSYDYLVSILSKEVVDDTMKRSLDEFVVELLVRLYVSHESDSFLAKYMRPEDAPPPPPYYSSGVVQSTLNYLPSCYFSPALSFVSTIAKKRDMIQSIFLSLNLRLFSTHRLFERKYVLLAYSLFTRLVCQELRTGLGGSLAYVVMEIIYSMIRVLDYHSSEEMKELFSPLCDTLYTLCKSGIQECPEILGIHYHILFTKLLPMVTLNCKDRNQALHLFEYLIDNSNKLSLIDHVTSLDPFPDISLFSNINNKLKCLKSIKDPSISEELNLFSSSEQLIGFEGLKHINHILNTNRSVVHHLIEKNDPHVKSPVIDFIQVMVVFAKTAVTSSHSTDNRSIITWITRCLGIIGYMDLSCIALPQKRKYQGNVKKSIGELYEILAGFLKDMNIEVVNKTSSCLKALLSTQHGSNLLNKAKQDSSSNHLDVLEPFKLHRKKKVVSTSVHSYTNTTPVIIDNSSWQPTRSDHTHSKWLTNLVLSLLSSGWVKNEILLLLQPVCEVKVELCEWIFPFIIHDILSTGIQEYNDTLSQHVQNFFISVNNSSSPNNTVATSALTYSINTMLNMIMYLRTVDRLKKGSAWDNNFWLQLDFLEISKAAMLCSSSFTALLYIEIWHAHQLNNIYTQEASGEDTTSLNPLCAHPSVQNDLLEVYGHIGEPDSLYGAIILFSPQEELRRRWYEHEGQWDKALNAYNWQLKSPTSLHSNLVEALKNLGLPHVLEMYVKGVEMSHPQDMKKLLEFQYESAWRYSMWENQDQSSLIPQCEGFHSLVNNCLSAIKQEKKLLFEDYLYSARYEAIYELCSGRIENVSTIYPCLTKLQALLELEETGLLLFESDSSTFHFNLLTNWKERLVQMGTDFQYIDLILSMRATCIYTLMKNHSSFRNSQLCRGLFEVLLTHAKLAREAGKYQIAEGALFTLKHLTNDLNYPTLSWEGCLEEAELCWARGETPLAIMVMKRLLESIENLDPSPPSADSVYPRALCLYGKWLADTKSENPVVILDHYLKKATSIMETQTHSRLIQAYLTLARFADSQYEILSRQMKTERHEAKRNLLQKSKRDLQTMTKVSADDKTMQRHVRQLQMQSKEDESVIKQQIMDQKHFLQIALNNYVLCLKAGDDHDLRVFRVCSLWFSNSHDDNITSILKDGLSQLPSRKLLPLIYQLAARMSSNSSDPFQDILQQILYRICVDHPYHSLYVILALSNASLDNQFPQSNYVTGSRRSGTNSKKAKRLSIASGSSNRSVDEDKIKAALSLIDRLRMSHPILVNHISQLCEAYIDLAYHDVSVYRMEKNPIKLPPSCPLLKLSLKNIAIPTMDIPIDPTCQYDSIVCIKGFDSFITLCGGISLPKVISCLGTDGRRRTQLIKGRDDLRQDAVMQQVFCLVNKLLLKEPATAKRKLSIRTYKVIPLSQCSGIVEWCEGTIPLGNYLIGTNENPFEGSHSRYRPQDWTNKECRKKFATARNKDDKMKVYKQICCHFKPVFHNFFMEMFLCPSLWFERRLAYIRSVAASSIVGYIVGLGDRHIQNILIDKQTAEFIHIDLGVAFEQGKTLPTPEMIPFRLTRDLIDGMGVTGVEGVFRRCCEETLTVMRSSHEELKTIVEVLLYDPLYLWNITPRKVQSLQGKVIDESTPSRSTETSTTNANKMAERVLIRLQEKLEGVEDGTQLSVSGQVSHLIQEATDTLNLSMLFHGWQPWV